MACQHNLTSSMSQCTGVFEQGPCSVIFGAGTMLLISEGTPCRLSFQRATPSHQLVDLDSTSHLLATPQHAVAELQGARTYQLIDENRLCRMLAFVDAALGVPEGLTPAAQTLSISTVAPDVAAHPARLEHWLALAVMRGDTHSELIAHLRRQEAYQLTDYLLRSPPGDCAQLNQLCKRYGLSYSHFRRLCCRALGGAPKPRLRVWRASRALLDLLDGNQPVLSIALENGYTSASHISVDIKQLFGVTPRMAKNASALLP